MADPIANNEKMRRPTISKVEIKSLHGSHDLEFDLSPGLNIVEGKNGSGKTTCVHILANLMELDIERFCHLKFGSITIKTDRGCLIELRKTQDELDRIVRVYVDGGLITTVEPEQALEQAPRLLLSERLGGRPVYLPAFRSILEAASGQRNRYVGEVREKEIERLAKREMSDERSVRANQRVNPYFRLETRAQLVAQKTLMCRDWFGQFVPVIRCPSMAEISEELAGELAFAQIQVATTDREALSSVFVDVIRAAFGQISANGTDDVNQLLIDVQRHLSSLERVHADASTEYSTIAELIRSIPQTSWAAGSEVHRILKVYERALRNRARAQEQAFSRIRVFQESVNKFLENKTLAFDISGSGAIRGMPYYILIDQTRKAQLNVLSSGERHVLSLLFAATHMNSSDGILLIDEPELSLHVDWQRIILAELMRQAGDRQVIACSHSPEVAADHNSCVVKIQPRSANNRALLAHSSDPNEEE